MNQPFECARASGPLWATTDRAGRPQIRIETAKIGKRYGLRRLTCLRCRHPNDRVCGGHLSARAAVVGMATKGNGRAAAEAHGPTPLDNQAGSPSLVASAATALPCPWHCPAQPDHSVAALAPAAFPAGRHQVRRGLLVHEQHSRLDAGRSQQGSQAVAARARQIGRGPRCGARPWARRAAWHLRQLARTERRRVAVANSKLTK